MRLRQQIAAAFLVLSLLILSVAVRSAEPATSTSSRAPQSTSSAPSHLVGIPDTVTLDQLQKAGQDLYAAVPFAHRRHAQMAEMWDGCTTCHHHTPEPGAAAATQPATQAHTQNDSTRIPACRSCHPLIAENTTIAMPSLKGAYHRQCLNCHRDWMDTNACNICHAERNPAGPATMPTPDDIIGRMHPPIAAPTTRPYIARFTPVAGPNVLFRHEEHAKAFGLKCVTCHRHDSCDQCHQNTRKTGSLVSVTLSADPTTLSTTASALPPSGSTSFTAEPKLEGSHPLRPGRTWQASHGPCISCHQGARCVHCHYQTGESSPPEFSHARTRQPLDPAHLKLACADCHRDLNPENLTCGDTSCHKRAIAWPADRPGPRVELQATPTSHPATASAPASQPITTRPVVIRIRRGGQ